MPKSFGVEKKTNVKTRVHQLIMAIQVDFFFFGGS